MSGNHSENPDLPAVRSNWVEVGVASCLLFVSCLVIYDSYQLGKSWGDDGPESGYFPFYVGILLFFSSLGIIIQALFSWKKHSKNVFAQYGQLRLVGAVFFPTLVYIALLGTMGFYLWSAVFIGWFMKVLGKYSWTKAIVIPLIVAIAIYLIFDVAFSTPLHKGIIENLILDQ